MVTRIDVNAGSPKGSFRWAIVGYGKVAVAHTEGIMRARHTLVGFSTKNEPVRSGDATGITFNIGPTNGRLFYPTHMIAVPDWESLLSDVQGNADGIIVCCPTEHHVTVAKAAAIAGFNCFLEKPMAGNMRDARELQGFFSGRPQQLVVGHVLPAFPEFAALRETLLTKGIQNVTKLVMRRFVPWADTDDEAGNRAKGGAAGDLIIHDIQLLPSVARVMSVTVERCDKRYDLMQTLMLSLQMEGATVPFTVAGGAHRSFDGFSHSYEVTFSDGTSLVFGGELVSGEDVTGYHTQIEKKSVGEVFGEELSIAADFFQGRRMDAAYLDPTMALAALKVLDDVEKSTR